MSVERDFPWLQAEEQQQRGPFVPLIPIPAPWDFPPVLGSLWAGGIRRNKTSPASGSAWTHQESSQSFSWHFSDPSSSVEELWNRVEQGGRGWKCRSLA